jgi:PAS domain S-box-containing protein
VIFLTTITLVSVFFVDRIQTDLRQLTEINEPLEKAVIGMEINARETARSITRYVQDLNAQSLLETMHSTSDFEVYASQFGKLATTEKERTLIQKVTEAYREFRSLGIKITSSATLRGSNLQTLRQHIEKIDTLIDDKLRPAIDRSSVEGVAKFEALSNMDRDINQVLTSVQGFFWSPVPEFRQKAEVAEKQFKLFRTQYSEFRLSLLENKILGLIDSEFSGAVDKSSGIIITTTTLRENLDTFQTYLKQIHQILDGEIQGLILAETRLAAKDAHETGEIAIAVVIVVGVLTFITTVFLNFQVSTDIVGGLSRLGIGVKEFTRGNFDHRIALKAKGELSVLADHFNEMAARRKDDEAMLRESEENLRTTLNSISDAVIATDISSNIILMNPVAEKLTGWRWSEAKGRPLSEVFHVIDRKTGEPALNLVQSVLENGTMVGLANHTKLVARDGTQHHISDSAAPICDTENRTSGVVLVFRDVSEEYQLRKTLEASEEHLRSAFDHVVVGNIITDEYGIIASYNLAAQGIFGYFEHEVIGQNIAMLMPNSFGKNHDTYIQNYKDTAKSKIIGRGRETIGLRKNGEEFPMHLGIGEMIIDNSKSFIGSITDLTEFKNVEKKLFNAERIHVAGQLSGGIAHDFNNLMGIMIGNAELLKQSVAGDEKALLRIERIKAAVRRGASLTDRLLAFSRKQRLAPKATDIDRLIDGLDDALQRLLGKTIQVECVANSDLWLSIADPLQLEHALISLAENAQDAMPNGGTLTVETTNATLDKAFTDQCEELLPGDYVKISVRDNGTGMTREAHSKAFEPYFTTKDVGQGSGLGLSMVYGFAKQSGGHVAICSEAEKGTTVSIYLPRFQNSSDQEIH